MRRLREKLTYANIVASLALFIALGGTSYALTLPRNSVGSKQIRSGAVGGSEIRSSAVASRDVRDRSLSVRDLSLAARNSLRGQAGPAGPAGAQGPPGPAYRATMNSVGELIRGNPRFATRRGLNQYRFDFGSSSADCVATASLARDEGVSNSPPPTGRLTVSREGGTNVVRTYDASGNPASRAVNIIAAC